MSCDDLVPARWRSLDGLPSAFARRAAVREVLGALAPADACAALEATIRRGMLRRRDDGALLAVTGWIAGELGARAGAVGARVGLRRRIDPGLLARLAEEALRGAAFPLTAAILSPPPTFPRPRLHLGDGARVDVSNLLVQQLLRRRNILELWHGAASDWHQWRSPSFALRGERSTRSLRSLLDTAWLDLRVVVRFATMSPLPTEVWTELVAREVWFRCLEVRTALASNRSAPACLVTALLPVVPAATLRALAGGRHADPIVAPAARSFLALRQGAVS